MDWQRPGLQPGEKIMVAMSGGVDSSVAALLLKEAGFNPIGVTLRLWVDPEAEEKAFEESRGCCSLEAVSDARDVARIIDIPHYTLNMKDAFYDRVVLYFIREYLEGRTPNPCIACNRYIKFSLLLEKAKALGINFIATGHYARSIYDFERGIFRLFRGADLKKDQSYMLYAMNQPQLASVLFPLGGYTKDKVRSLARDAGLRVSEKKESQEICFIPDNDYRSFLKRGNFSFAPGDIVSTAGEKLGRHKGLPFYTIGQRKGLGLSSTRPLYVVDIDIKNNLLIVGEEEKTYSRGLIAEELNFVSGFAPTEPLQVNVKIRYRAPLVPATLFPPEETPSGRNDYKCEKGGGASERTNVPPLKSMAKIIFSEKQKAVTPGQAAVFYQGNEIIGGGIISARIS